jgi:hypothetical protein
LVIFNIIISGFGYQVIDYFEKKDKPLFFSPQFIVLPISLVNEGRFEVVVGPVVF